jgi:aspartate 1-decarboxylase
MNNFHQISSRPSIASACLLALMSLGAGAATTFTGAIDTDITNVGNWDNGLPDNAGNDGIIPSGLSTTYTGNTAALNFNGTWNGTATLSGDNSRIDNGFLTFNDTSSYVSPNTIAIARDGGSGTININGSAIVRTTGAVAGGDIKIGRAGSAFVNQTGGLLDAFLDIELGVNNGGTGVYNLSGGTAVGERLLFGALATNVFNFTPGSTGVLTIRNGGADYTTVFEGYIGAGQITINGAAANTGDFLINYTGTETSIQIPEPGSAVLGLLGAAFLLRRRRR